MSGFYVSRQIIQTGKFINLPSYHSLSYTRSNFEIPSVLNIWQYSRSLSRRSRTSSRAFISDFAAYQFARARRSEMTQHDLGDFSSIRRQSTNFREKSDFTTNLCVFISKLHMRHTSSDVIEIVASVDIDRFSAVHPNDERMTLMFSLNFALVLETFCWSRKSIWISTDTHESESTESSECEIITKEIFNLIPIEKDISLLHSNKDLQ